MIRPMNSNRLWRFDEHPIDGRRLQLSRRGATQLVEFCRRLCGQAFVAVMEPTDLGNSNDWTIVNVRR